MLISTHIKWETEFPNPSKNLPLEELLSVGFEANC